MSMRRLQQGRYGACAATWRGRVYVFGGSTSEGYTGAVAVINPTTGNVSVLPWTTMPRRYAGAVALGEFLYIVGGTGEAEFPQDLERVDPRTGKVEKCRPVPNPHINAVAVAANDQLWIIGGSVPGGFTGAMDIYDPKRDSWEKGPQLPVARECAGVVHNGLIHVMGGYAGEAGMRRHDIYTVNQGNWSHGADLPNPTSAHHTAVIANTAWSFGDYAALDRVRACDLRSGKWFLPHLSEPFVPRRHAAVAVASDTIVVVGGNNGGNNSYLDTVQIFRL